MDGFRFEPLDPADDAVRAEYESAFYEAFAGVTSNRLIRKLWLWDHDRGRLATRIPYEEQLLFGYRGESGRLEVAVACNIVLRELQASAFGFAIPEGATSSFEVLTFFTRQDHRLKVKLDFWKQSLEAMRALGYSTGFATTARRPLKPYLWIGWKLLEQRVIEGEERFFLRYELGQ